MKLEIATNPLVKQETKGIRKAKQLQNKFRLAT